MEGYTRASHTGSDAQLPTQYLHDIARFSQHSSESERCEQEGIPIQQALIERHLHTIVEIAYQYRGQGVPLADLIGEGNLYLVQCTQACVQVSQFTSSLEHSLHQIMQRLIAIHATETSHLSLDTLRPNAVGGAHLLDHRTPEEIFIAQEASTALRLWLTWLSPRQRQALLRYYGLTGDATHRTFSAIGRELGISASAVRDHTIAARRRLRRRSFGSLLQDVCASFIS